MNEQVENLGLRIKPRLMVAIGHHVKNISENPHVVLGIKQISNLFIGIDIVQDILQKIQPQVTVGTKLMPERPHHTVKNDIKVRLVKRVQEAEVELDERLEKGKEVGADLWERVEVSGNERETAGEDHLQQIGQEIRVNNNTQLLQHNSKQRDKLLLFRLRNTVLKILQQGPQWQHNGIQYIRARLAIQVVALF
jgi:hypothetical protein